MGQIRDENNEVAGSNIEALGCKRSKALGFSGELIVCFEKFSNTHVTF